MKELDTEEYNGNLEQKEAVEYAFSCLMNLHACIDEIGEGEDCIECGALTTKMLVSYNYDYAINEDTAVTFTKRLPGYLCKQCNAKYLNADLSDRFTAAVAQVLLVAFGDPTLAAILSNSNHTRSAESMLAPTNHM